MTDLQKAGWSKRLFAFIFDGILLAVLAVAMAVFFSFVSGYDAQVERMDAIRTQYEQQYNIDATIEPQNYQGTAEEQAAYQERWDQANEALQKDDEWFGLYRSTFSLQLMSLTFSPLAAILLMEFFIPLLFGNGQTLGKKIFGIGVMGIEGVRITGKQVFIRSVLGKYTVELMLPIYIAMMTLFGVLDGIVGLGLLAALLIAQIVCLFITRTNAPIHDVFAATVAVDLASQRIFEDIEDRDNYIKAKHAERAARAEY